MVNPEGGQPAKRTPLRRTVVKSAAWTVPVIAVGVAAPASAASSVVCPVVPPSGSWGSSTTGSFNLGTKSWGSDPSGTPTFKEYADNASTTATASISTFVDVPVAAGVTYTLTFNTAWGYGNYNPGTSAGSSVSVTFGDQTFTGATRSGDLGPNSANILASPRYTPRTLVYQSTSAGTVHIQITIIVDPRRNIIGGANDDIFVTMPLFEACART